MLACEIKFEKLNNINVAVTTCFFCLFLFFLPVPFRLPKLLDLSEGELLLPSPAEPDFALFPFSRLDEMCKTQENTSRSKLILQHYSRYLKAWSIKAESVKTASVADKTTPPWTELFCGCVCLLASLLYIFGLKTVRLLCLCDPTASQV